MATGALERIEPWTSSSHVQPSYDEPPRNIAYIESIDFDKSLQPKNYDIAGTNVESKILILDVQILDATGTSPYRGDVLIQGESRMP
jgi:hypothetical protein